MPTYQADAIVLRRLDYGEADRILTLLTREHGKLAARLATQVIKAYVDKQRRQPTKVASSGKVDVGALWNAGSGADDDLHGGHFDIEAPKSRAPLAVAAPGLQ